MNVTNSTELDSTVEQVIKILLAIVNNNRVVPAENKFHDANHEAVFGFRWKYQQMTLCEFFANIQGQSNCPSNIYVLALCLMKKYEQTLQFENLNSTTVHRVFYTCLALAYKFLEDEVFVDSDFALLGLVSLPQYKQMELHVLQALEFSTYISQEEFEKMQTKVHEVDVLSSSCLTVSELFEDPPCCIEPSNLTQHSTSPKHQKSVSQGLTKLFKFKATSSRTPRLHKSLSD